MGPKVITNSLALFDFDGTLTTKDSFIAFIKYYHGTARLLMGLVLNLPVLLIYKARLLPNWKAKERIMQYFFGGVDLVKFNQKAREFSIVEIPKMLKNDMIEHLSRHKEVGNDVFLVSASFENWLIPWAERLGLTVIGSRVESTSSKVTGKIDGKNCYGPEKVIRVQQQVDVSKYEKIYSYGDSRGDREMLALADFAIYRGKLVSNVQS